MDTRLRFRAEKVSLSEHYVLRGGQRGFTRLQILARERWPDTETLLVRAGLAPGMTVADLGCGSGDVTVGIARMIEPGQAVGIDMDEIKLDLARKEAKELGVNNVVFRAMNLHDWIEPSSYDAVYTRFVLQHLSDPGEMLKRMWESLRPGGALIVEDADLDSWASDPESEGLAQLQRWYPELLRRSGGIASMGRKLPGLFRAAGIPVTSIEVLQRNYSDADAKTLPWSTLEATADGIASAGIASRADVDAALADLERLARDKDSFILSPRVVQVIARREAAATA